MVEGVRGGTVCLGANSRMETQKQQKSRFNNSKTVKSVNRKGYPVVETEGPAGKTTVDQPRKIAKSWRLAVGSWRLTVNGDGWRFGGSSSGNNRW